LSVTSYIKNWNLMRIINQNLLWGFITSWVKSIECWFGSHSRSLWRKLDILKLNWFNLFISRLIIVTQCLVPSLGSLSWTWVLLWSFRKIFINLRFQVLRLLSHLYWVLLIINGLVIYYMSCLFWINRSTFSKIFIIILNAIP
jgi:hypothetical protein